MTRTLSGLAALVAAFFLTSASLALDCGPRPLLQAWLKESHGEVPAFAGLDGQGNQFLLYLDPKSGSWTALLRPRQAPDLLCLLQSGAAGRLLWPGGPQVALPLPRANPGRDSAPAGPAPRRRTA